MLGRNAGIQIFTHDLNTNTWLLCGLGSLAAGAPLPDLANRPDVSPGYYVAGGFLHVVYHTANAPITDAIDNSGTIGYTGRTFVETVFNGTRWFRLNVITGADASVWSAPTVRTRGNTLMLFWSDQLTLNGAPNWDGGRDGEMGDFALSEFQVTYTQPNFFSINFLFNFDF
jgi:hypothetical protein